jgi:uncharacterized membrane protein
MLDSGPPTEPPAAHLHPRVVTWRHAFAWYEEAMRLFKFAPLTFVGLALLTIATELLLKAIPGVAALAGEIVTPLVACGLLYASAAADRQETPSLSVALEVFRAGSGAITAIVVASLVAFVAQALAGWWIADANLLQYESMSQLSIPAVLGIYAFGTLAALPVTFVPLLVLFERVPLREAFVISGVAFAQNTLPLIVYGAASLVLLIFGLLTAGIGLVIALPLWAASSYAAWKDVFGLRDAPAS